MSDYKTELKKILTLVNLDTLPEQINSVTKLINEKDLAHFFIDSIYLKNVIAYIIEEHWIQSKNSTNDIYFDRFIKKYFDAELKPLLFLHSYFLSTNIEEMHTSVKALAQTEKLVISFIKSSPFPFQKTVLQIALARMSELFELEHQMNSDEEKKPSDTKLSLYRSFDSLDQIFDLDYLLNEVPALDQKERLYEGAGVGVQSSYATTLIALRYLNLAKGSRFIDLGSGYGRIGLVIGLMRPDIQFTGYEFVQERVAIANKASVHFNLNQHVNFIAQDLSSPEFKIPMADTYYIFDAFTDSSFKTIIEQLQVLTATRKITVVTKGNAKMWMSKTFWSAPQEFNDGNLCLFRSSSSVKS
ncbi:MAG: hypothetical protein H7256_03370 [Bdellovibrio sp.]|nr:hypothetical protein [Bdellovibrio sp.]